MSVTVLTTDGYVSLLRTLTPGFVPAHNLGVVWLTSDA